MSEIVIPGFRGRQIGPANNDYDEARALYNGMIDKRPKLIARCANVADVIAAVGYGRDNKLLLAVRGGGHNGPGFGSCNDGLVVDLSQLKGIRIDPKARTVRVEPGCTSADVDHATHAFGLAVPFGIVGSTGVAGLTLGGGSGYLTRKHGLTIDNLLEVDMVLADGSFVTANKDTHPDLFWALRGGGGNFGVVTELEFELYPVGPTVASSVAVYPIAEAARCLRELRAVALGLPESTSPIAVLTPVPDDDAFPASVRGADALFVLGIATGSLEDGAAALAPIARLGDGAVVDLGGPTSYADFQQFFDADYPAHTMRYYWKSSFAEDMPDALIADLVDAFGRRPSHHSTIDIWANGGAIERVSSAESAFGQRSAPWLISPESNWESADEDQANLAWGREIVATVGGSAYLNFPGLLEEGEQQARTSHGSTFERLAEVKRAWDPDNLFRFNANITPASRTERPS
jgi:FAD/FMN-containing dehydrogenase